jgi:hypothetical protein
MVTDLRWDDVKQWFDPVGNGSAPDLIVADTTLTHWQLLTDLIRSSGWPCRYEHGDRPAPVPESAADLFRADAAEQGTSLRVWPHPDLEWIIRPWIPEEIVGDVDLHQIQGQLRLDAFCHFLRTLGDALQKDILMYSEGDNSYPPMLAYDQATRSVTFLPGSW